MELGCRGGGVMGAETEEEGGQKRVPDRANTMFKDRNSINIC